MSFFIDIFHTVLYKPLFNALVLLYQYLPGGDFGIAIIVLTVLIRFLLFPLMIKSIRAQKEMAELQPKLQEIQSRYKNDKEKQTRETMELYKRERVNPFGGCLPFLLQLPILVALYRVFWRGLDPSTMKYLYGFVPDPGEINPVFLGVMNLAEPNVIIALAAGAAQFLQSKTLFPVQQKSQQKNMPGGQFAQAMQKQMLYFFPIITIIILLKLPSAIGIYWIITALFSAAQQRLILGKKNEPAGPQFN